MSAATPDQLVQRFLRSLRNQFYQGKDKRFFQEERLLKMAIFEPARWLESRGVRISAQRYQEILAEIIRIINRHGNLAGVRSMGRYLLHAVQEHMKHHGEDYYYAATATRNAVEDVMQGLRRQHQLTAEGRAIQAGDSTVATLAEAARLLASSKSGRRKAIAKPLQPDLFALASAKKTAARDSSRASKSSQTFDNSGVSPQKILKPSPRDSISRKSLI